MKIPFLLAAAFPSLPAKLSLLLAVPLLLGAVASAQGAPFTFDTTASLNTARNFHTATLLPNGKLLVAGGVGTSGVLTSAELYDPASGSWTATGSLNTARYQHTATLLPNGKVLVAGGYNGSALTSAELYDPASGTWTATGSLNTARVAHTATLLPNGKVLVAGGANGSFLTSAELYDPAANGGAGAWTATNSLNTARVAHTATLLPNGKVLVAGGFGTSSYLTSAELYDPASGSWTATGSLNTARENHTATLLPNGNVLVAGGANNNFLTSAELYDPASGTWAATSGLNTARDIHTATLLPNGKVLVAGGVGTSSALTSAELYDPASGSWTATGSLNTARYNHTATLLPNGKVLVAGGFGTSSYLTSAELYDPASGSWTATGSLNTARNSHTATLLPNGKVLVAGGFNNSGALTSAELYDPASGTWTATGSLNTARDSHTATLLPNGKVLVAGGYNGGALTSAELYDPASGSWTATGSLNTARNSHTATLLPNGKVLVAGGFNNSGALTSAELYDPASGTWTATGSLNTGRYEHTATLLPNGKVLVGGGIDSSVNPSVSAELYDPASGTWTATASLNTARYIHTATLLPNGKVLVAGGKNSSALTSAELYDIGLGFVRPGWQPQITTATSPLTTSSSLMLTGSRFQGISQASGGNFQDSSTNYPVVQLRGIDSNQVAFLPVKSTAGWSDTSFTSTPLNNFPPGPALVTVFTNGIPSDSKYVVVAAAATHYNVSAPSTATAGTPFNFTVTALDQFNNTATSYTGTVQFSSNDGQAVLPAGSTLTNGVGTFSATLKTAGNQTITATDGTITGASNSIAVSAAAATHYSVSTPSSAAAGTAFNFTVTALDQFNNTATGYTGTVRFSSSDGSATLPANSTLSNGTGTFSTTLKTAGNQTITATDTASSSVTGTSNSIAVSAAAATHYSVSAPSSATTGTAFNFTVTALDQFNNTATGYTGTVRFSSSDGSATLPANSTLSNGTGTFSATLRTAGNQTITGTDTVTSSINGTSNLIAVASPTPTPTPTPTATPTPTPTPTPTATPTPTPGSLGNISTRLQVGTGNNVLFAGFIIQGNASKTVLIRSAGPSLTSFGVPGALGDPQLELHDANNLIGTNDNWQTTQLGGVITSDQVAAIQNTGVAPANPAEPAIIATLAAGQYTAIVQGVGGTQGVATVEVYDLSPNNGATLANISTRGFIQTGDNVMIGGFIVVGQSSRVLIRATGPSLIPFGINNALANPRLELHDANGTLAMNDDWQTTQLGGIITSDQSAAIQNTGLAPGNPAESAIIATLAPGAYTAIAQGVNGGTGVGLVEVFALP